MYYTQVVLVSSQRVKQGGDLTVKKHIIYESPPSHVIDQYAREVCQQLGQRVDVTYDTPEMSRELARFLKVVATICVKAMNKYDQPFASQD